MRSVSRFEVQLLRVLHVLLQRAPLEPIMTMLTKPLPRPKCLGRDAVELVQGTLAKGCVRFLARLGWMRERHLRGGQVVEGRLWERTPPTELGLSFSPHALEFLMQLVSGTLGTTKPKPQELALGDRLLFFLAFDALKQTQHGAAMRNKWPSLRQDGLCRLAFLEELAGEKERFRIDWLPWTMGLGSVILEALQGWLAQRWKKLENKKQTLSAVSHMRSIGANQERVFGEYLDALDNVQRRDLARCFLDAAKRVLREQPTARLWIRNLDVRNERIADRLAIHHEVLALLRQLPRLQEWQRQALGVGYFDESYPSSQLWKADWERHEGERICAAALAIVREVEPMK